MQHFEAMFNALVELSPIGVGFAKDGITVRANQVYLDMFGYADLDEIREQSLLDMIAPQCRDEVSARVRARAQGLPTENLYQTRGLRKNGTEFPLLISAKRIETSEGPLTLAFLIDVSEQKRNEAKFKALFETTKDAVMLLDEQGFFECNQAVLDMYGCRTREEFLSKHPAELSPSHQPNGRDSFGLANEYIARAFETGKQNFEWLHRRCDNGQEFYAEVLLSPFELDGKQVLQASVRDITKRKRNDAELRIAAAAFESQTSMLITDADGRMQKVNQAFTECTGYTLAEVVGKKPAMLKSGRHDAAFYRAMWDCINQTGSWQGEVWDRRKNGEIYPKWLSIAAVKDQYGAVTHYVGSHIDITDRHQNYEQLQLAADELVRANLEIEAEREHLVRRVEERTSQLRFANQAKDSFLATMSHEIRTPLGGLLGMMELLSLSSLSSEQAEMLGAARRSGKSLLRIVNDILDWSKIEAGKLALSPSVGSVQELLKNVAGTYAQIASEKCINLKIEVDPELGQAHCFDALRISQILNNFTSNALKFTQQGFVKLSAERVMRHSDSEEIRFSVQDCGMGISPDQLERLFQNYEQASSDTARMYGGTGLGLAICRRLADMMGGTLAVESALGVGSIFSFNVCFPLASQEEQHELQQDRAQAANDAGASDAAPLFTEGAAVSILIVDDHPLNRMLLRQQLGMLGVRVTQAEDGAQALEKYRSQNFDLIITDCHMPEMDGYELAQAIRQSEGRSGGRRIPIIAWTANVLAEEAGHCQQAGMDELLTKPTEFADLRAMLLKYLVGDDRAGR